MSETNLQNGGYERCVQRPGHNASKGGAELRRLLRHLRGTNAVSYADLDAAHAPGRRFSRHGVLGDIVSAGRGEVEAAGGHLGQILRRHGLFPKIRAIRGLQLPLPRAELDDHKGVPDERRHLRRRHLDYAAPRQRGRTERENGSRQHERSRDLQTELQHVERVRPVRRDQSALVTRAGGCHRGLLEPIGGHEAPARTAHASATRE